MANHVQSRQIVLIEHRMWRDSLATLASGPAPKVTGLEVSGKPDKRKRAL
jgi:hypothetical protein